MIYINIYTVHQYIWDFGFNYLCNQKTQIYVYTNLCKYCYIYTVGVACKWEATLVTTGVDDVAVSFDFWRQNWLLLQGLAWLLLK